MYVFDLIEVKEPSFLKDMSIHDDNVSEQDKNVLKKRTASKKIKALVDEQIERQKGFGQGAKETLKQLSIVVKI
jgi:hypothetical protein